MADFYPNTQVEDENSILVLIGEKRLEEEDDTRTEIGSPNPGNNGVDTGSLKAGNNEVDTASPNAINNDGENTIDVTSNTTAPSTTSSNDVVASLISQANTIGMDTRFPFPSFSDIQKMTKEDYEKLQDQMQAFSFIKFSNNINHLKKQKAKEIEEDIEKYKREASRFRMISTENMTKFAESRLGLSKIQDLINIYTSLTYRIVLPGDFPNSASNYAQYPNIITFAKEITGPNDTEPRYIYVDPDTAATPGPGHIAKTIYTAQWLASKAETATIEDPIPDPLNIYDTGELWKHISLELQEKHVGRIHPNLCRPIYLNIPRTEPDWEDQNGERHKTAFELEIMNHDDPWAIYVRDYNRIRTKALQTQVVDKKADEAASKKNRLRQNAPKPMKPLLCSYEDAEEYLAITLEEAVKDRILATSLPRRGNDQHIADCLKKCLVEYATKTKRLYKDLFFHIAACEMTIYCARQQTPVWSSENLMSQDPQQKNT